MMKYVKDHYSFYILCFLLIFFFDIILYLEGVSFTLLYYPTSLSLFFILVYFIVQCIRYCQQLNHLDELSHLDHIYIENMPQPQSFLETSYDKVIENIIHANIVLNEQKDHSYHELSDYMTLWVHQIKTPIAALRLLIQSGELSAHLILMQVLRIEQYVDMMMYFIKMGNMHHDLKIGRYNMETLIHEVVKKQSLFFIHKKISLKLENLNHVILTDEKWASFIIEQVLSNALKYTNEGYVHIYMKGETLFIEDSGIGIKEEDLPRVFEKGFTGANGRLDKKASGIGLYLVKTICDSLGYSVHIDSKINQGTKVSVCFEKKPLVVE